MVSFRSICPLVWEALHSFTGEKRMTDPNKYSVRKAGAVLRLVNYVTVCCGVGAFLPRWRNRSKQWHTLWLGGLDCCSHWFIISYTAKGP